MEVITNRHIVTPCCTTLLCYINTRWPNYCSECGTRIYPKVKECVIDETDYYLIPTKGKANAT